MTHREIRLTDREGDDEVREVVHESREAGKDVSVEHTGQCALTVRREGCSVSWFSSLEALM